MKKFNVIIVAGGSGLRMGTAERKQFLNLRGKPVLIHTLFRFHEMEETDRIVLVVGTDDQARCAAWVAEYGLAKVRHIVVGGRERQHSVYNGIQALPSGTEWVLVHDGVRPFVSRNQILSCWHGAMEHGAAALAVPVKDTIKIANESLQVKMTPERRSLWAVQTPQAFRFSLLREVHERAVADQYIGTDDASLVERTGGLVQLVEGDYRNIKLTTPDDLLWAEWWLQRGEKEL